MLDCTTTCSYSSLEVKEACDGDQRYDWVSMRIEEHRLSYHPKLKVGIARLKLEDGSFKSLRAEGELEWLCLSQIFSQPELYLPPDGWLMSGPEDQYDH